MKLKTISRAMLLAAGLTVSFGALANDKPVIEVWTMSLSPKFDNYFKDLVSKYNAQNPKVEVKWTDYPWDVIQAKFTAAVGAGKPPALVNLNVPWAYDYKQDGLIQPIDAIVNKAQYAKGALTDVTFEGKVYAFPHYNGANITAYNKDLFTRAGLKAAPKTLDEQLNFSKIIKAKTGVAGFAPTLGPTKIEGFFIQNGLDVIKGGKAVFNSPAHVVMVKKLADAYKAGALLKDNLFAQDSFGQQMQAYNAGKMAMLVSTPTSLVRIRDEAPLLYKLTEVAPAPVGPTGIASGGWMFNFAVAKNVDKALLPEVGKFATFLTNDANQLAFSKLSGTLPTAAKAAKDPHFQTVAAPGGAVEKAVAVAAGNLDSTRTIFLSGVKDSEVLSNRLAAAVEQAVTGRKDAKAALDEAAAFWNSKL